MRVGTPVGVPVGGTEWSTVITALVISTVDTETDKTPREPSTDWMEPTDEAAAVTAATITE